MRLRFWPTRDERTANLKQRLRQAQQHAVRLKFGNQELARANVTLTRDLAKALRQRDVALAQLAVSCEALEAQADPVDEHAAQAIRALSGQNATLPDAGLLHPHRPHRQDKP